MLKRMRAGFIGAIWRREDGQEAVEFLLALPILLVVMFGILELGNLFDVAHTMSGLGREGANIAARGTALDTVLQVTMANGSAIQLGGNGGVVASEITVQNGNPLVTNQLASNGYVGLSKIGPVGTMAAGLGGAALTDGKAYYAIEVFYIYDPFTPLKRLVNSVVPDTLYDRTVF